MSKKVGVILSGCGVLDGAEIHEAVLTLLALDRAGADIICLAPDKDQADVIDHVSGKPTPEKRNVLKEAARIARGKIQDVAKVSADQLDAVVLPGGYGAAKNLCTFARDGADAQVDSAVAKLLKDMHARKKPIGALCIAPAVLARLFDKVELTIGTDAGTAEKLQRMGARHKAASVGEVVVDAANKIVTTPCYMLATRISEVADGVEKLVKKLLSL
jgi:enhancing lycopene biosynthesis protein 2